MASVAAAIDTDLKDILVALGLTGITSNIKIREAPKKGEDFDTVPLVIIAPFVGTRSNPLGTEGSDNNTYRRDIWIIDGFEGDNETDQAKRELWHEQVHNAIERNGTDWRTKLPSAPSVWDIQIEDAPTFDREMFKANYAVQRVHVAIQSSE